MGTQTPTQSLQIECELVSKINFACHQNAFAILRNFQLKNNDPELALTDLTVTITSNPEFFAPKTWRVDAVVANSLSIIKDRDLKLNGQFLLGLRDSLRGEIQIQVTTEDDSLLAKSTHDIELLAFNEWGGSVFMPELLAAFVTPNDPAVERILKNASDILRKSGKADQIDGYQSKSRERVWEITSAIYSAIANLNISYALPPASFEKNGQKIRMPCQIIESGLATCLDTTLLFAAALEQAGLKPLVALPEEHAVVGVWLQPEGLPSLISDEAELLRKRQQLQDLLLIETTFVTTHPAPSFSKALQAANECLSPEKDSTFQVVIDIKQARSHQIKPLGLFTESTTSGNDAQTNPYESTLEEAPPLPSFDIETEEAEETPSGRLERWQRKLLDLTLNNPLLNHKTSKSSLLLICPDPGLLEDRLADGKKLSIQTTPAKIGQGQDESIHRQRTGDVISEEYARDALKKDTILVKLDETELSNRLVEIYRKAQTSLQEGGANTLYVALGFLLWKKEEKDERRYRAPLILVPVSLERKSVRNGVKLLLHDDEPRFNTTLLEMLRKDYGLEISGLDGELPKDHSGIDVAGIWNRIRLAIKEVSGFEVIEEVVLGHFSFAKYLMWKDLAERTEQLKQNAVVAHLIDNPKDIYPSGVDFVSIHDLDKEYTPTDLFIPLPADSSQIATIASADRGKDFVIFGPPGTGKSQTIANLITHLMAKGKTVLFVSEKTAALEVVHRRLQKIGIGQFCLQLHSNKAKKTDILNQLRSAWDSSCEKSEQAWKQEATELKLLRDKLNRFVVHLHKKHLNGLTPYRAMGIKIRDGQWSQGISFDWARANQHTEADLAKMRSSVERLSIQAKTIGTLTNSPFKMIFEGTWTPVWQSNLASAAQDLGQHAKTLAEQLQKVSQLLSLPLMQTTWERLENFEELFQLLLQSYRRQSGYALDADGLERIDTLELAITHLKAYANAQASLSCPYKPEAWRQLDGNTIANRWQQASRSWWPKSYFEKQALIKEMQNQGALGKPDPARDSVILLTLREEGEAIDRLDQQLSDLRVWRKHLSEPQQILDVQQLAQKIRVITGKLADDVSSLADIRRSIKSTLNEGNELLASDASIGLAASNFLNTLAQFKEAYKSFYILAGQPQPIASLENADLLSETQQFTQTLIDQQQELREWCNWRRARNEALELDLQPIINGLETGILEANNLELAFEAAYCNWWSNAIISEDEVLCAFSSPEQVADIEKFRSLDEKFQETSAAYVNALLRTGIPQKESRDIGAQWGVLNRELQKQRQHKPVRQLMQDIPTVIKTLAPCLMMSPLSIAQYLPTSQALFDVVIFDEASQITVWDAIGALARGRQVIVAGDPRQMPPSNRFGRQDDSEEYMEDAIHALDLESILSEMQGANFPELKLNWHYRSKQESLIAFSNYRYYDSSLITFPAPTVSDKGVSLKRINGVYARGSGRHNEIEAREIVKECVKRLTHSEQTIREKSIGIITFNTQQQTLIENLLDEERRKNPALEAAFSENTNEALFVKNLDTVQGDERDVILFSITFGPDKSGSPPTMNFGDLNRKGGERRLNVALTRARSEMIVFSSLSPDHINLSKTSAVAVADLKHFLEYADKGPTILGREVFGSVGDYDSPFEIAVANALRDKGWRVQTQIGVSSYRIDLGVVHPDKPGVYLAGVECDGAAYHSSATARDRDRIRHAQLEKNLGWSLLRIWSTDWWTNQAKSLEKLHDSLEQLLIDSRNKVSESIEGASVPEETTKSENFPIESELFIDTASAALQNSDEKSVVMDLLDDKPWTSDDYDKLQSILVTVLQNCPNQSCVKGDPYNPKQSDIVAKACQHLGLRTRGNKRQEFAHKIHRALRKLVSKGIVKEYMATNERIRLGSVDIHLSQR